MFLAKVLNVYFTTSQVGAIVVLRTSAFLGVSLYLNSLTTPVLLMPNYKLSLSQGSPHLLVALFFLAFNLIFLTTRIPTFYECDPKTYYLTFCDPQKIMIL